MAGSHIAGARTGASVELVNPTAGGMAKLSVLDAEMNNKSAAMAAIRYVSAYAVMVVGTALLYSLVSYGITVAPVRILLVGAFVAAFSTLIILPIALVVERFNSRRRVLILIAFLTILIAFFVWNIVEMSASTQLVAGPRSLVANGEITSLGYWVAVRDSLVTAMIGTAGFTAFVTVARFSPASKF